MTKEQFIEMITREQESLRRFLRGLCSGDGFRADDLAQEALLKAYLSFERYEGRSRFSTWLFRIAFNCWYDSQKKRGKEFEWLSFEDTSSVGPPDGPADSSMDVIYENQQLYMAIGNLSLQEQTVILLFYIEEKSIKEIEIITGMPSGTIRSHLSRGRRRLKEYLETL
ncbi:MAG: RNA polymerase sigma factor [Bacteroidales bacterium]|nr:RNA polymerase sigma factor [Bacteroidales bacterium]